MTRSTTRDLLAAGLAMACAACIVAGCGGSTGDPPMRGQQFLVQVHNRSGTAMVFAVSANGAALNGGQLYRLADGQSVPIGLGNACPPVVQVSGIRYGDLQTTPDLVFVNAETAPATGSATATYSFACPASIELTVTPQSVQVSFLERLPTTEDDGTAVGVVPVIITPLALPTVVATPLPTFYPAR